LPRGSETVRKRLFKSSIFSDWEIGAWLILATAVVYLLQIYLFAFRRKGLSVLDLKEEK
jgi:hypothetical protein